MKIKATVLKVSQKISPKTGQPYNQVEFGFANFSRGSFFIDERFIPDCLEGSEVELTFDLQFKNWKPDLKIVGVVK